jgi:SAM-dependent methyltransferase
MPTPTSVVATAAAYRCATPDAVRDTFERAWFARRIRRLLGLSGGGRVLDLGCGDGLAARIAPPAVCAYVGVDLDPPASESARTVFVPHDLRDGLGPVGDAPFELYLATFGLASHLRPGELDRLLAEIGRHARPGAIVALEALGLYSLEWPSLWSRPPGDGRLLPYRLGAEVTVHPWAPHELAARFDRAGIAWIGARDRSVQCGPKIGEGRYWPGLPPVREAMNRLLAGDPDAIPAACAALPPLPAGRAAAVHHVLAGRRSLVGRRRSSPPAELARRIWSIEPDTAGGLGHGLLAVGRVR